MAPFCSELSDLDLGKDRCNQRGHVISQGMIGVHWVKNIRVQGVQVVQVTSVENNAARILNKVKSKNTYNSRDSLVVTHPTTNRPACGLSTAERTGSPVFHTLWSYVLGLTEDL